MARKLKIIQVPLERETFRQLKELAQEEERHSVAAVARRAILEYLETALFPQAKAVNS
jgi:hypothetical protein